jgi:shikimate dehydrogenase
MPETHGGVIILSHHWPADGAMPPAREIGERLASIAARICPYGREPLPGQLAVDVVKMAAPVRTAGAALDWLPRPDLPVHVRWAPVPLGPAGTWMRLLARRHGLVAYLAAGRPLPGPDLGQVRLSDALGTFGTNRVSPSTRACGIFGWPLATTWSPLLHSELFRERGIDARMVPLPVLDAAEMARLLDALDLDGAAVTMPHKVAARALAGTESRRVAASGAVNTLRRRGGNVEAESFDGPAVASLLSEMLDLRDARVVIVGAGGAACAAAAELVAAGAHVTVVARRVDCAEAVASATHAAAAGLAELEGIPRDALVHATPAGSDGIPGLAMTPAALDAPIVLDMVTSPAETPLIARARARGRRVIDGLAMLAHQAAAQQVFWLEGTGVEPPTSAQALRVLRGLVAARG